MCIRDRDCPTQALAFGDVDDPDSAYSQARARLEARGARFWELDDAGTTTRYHIEYASTHQ